MSAMTVERKRHYETSSAPRTEWNRPIVSSFRDLHFSWEEIVKFRRREMEFHIVKIRAKTENVA